MYIQRVIPVCHQVRLLRAILTHFRRSRPRVFYKKDVLRNFAKCTGKHLCQRFFLNKVAGLRPKACNFIKKKSLAQVFSCEFCEISKNTFFPEHLRWLLLSLESFPNFDKLNPCDFERTVSDNENTGGGVCSSTMQTK